MVKVNKRWRDIGPPEHPTLLVAHGRLLYWFHKCRTPALRFIVLPVERSSREVESPLFWYVTYFSFFCQIAHELCGLRRDEGIGIGPVDCMAALVALLPVFLGCGAVTSVAV